MTLIMADAATAQLRNAELGELVQALREQHTRAVDVVVPAARLRASGGAIELCGIAPRITQSGWASRTGDGVSPVDGCYRPTGVGEEGLADKLDIPLAYLRRCRAQALEVYDANLNGWLTRTDRSYLLRLLTHPGGVGPDHTAGVLRAFVSDRYRAIDNIDVLMAALAGLRDAGVNAPVVDADLTDRRMVVRVTAPQIHVLAPELLRGYRNPFTDAPSWTWQALAGHGSDGDPIVFAGFVISNSETGGGRFAITPRIVVRICRNGMTITRDALSNVHVGAVLDEGVVRWSADTLRKSLDLVTAQTHDAVRTFLDRDYVAAKVADLETQAAAAVHDPHTVIGLVAKQLGFTAQEQADILHHFIRGAQSTAGGVMHAITATAQTAPAERAWELEAAALPTLDAAAALARR